MPRFNCRRRSWKGRPFWHRCGVAAPRGQPLLRVWGWKLWRYHVQLHIHLFKEVWSQNLFEIYMVIIIYTVHGHSSMFLEQPAVPDRLKACVASVAKPLIWFVGRLEKNSEKDHTMEEHTTKQPPQYRANISRELQDQQQQPQQSRNQSSNKSSGKQLQSQDKAKHQNPTITWKRNKAATTEHQPKQQNQQQHYLEKRKQQHVITTNKMHQQL